MQEVTIDISAGARHILDLLDKAGFEAYVVGGCVRDAMLGLAPKDFDICTAATPDEIKAVMSSNAIKTLDTGIKHGTVTVIVDREPFETTSYRSDACYSDGRHPDSVEFVRDIDVDLARRDFTVNAMAYSPRRGLVDLFGGREDLSTHTLRCVRKPHERFSEDALRILRALRFASTYGFKIESESSAAIHADCALLSKIAFERIWDEFSKLLMGEHCVEVLRAYRDVVAVIIPEIEPEFDFDQHNPYHRYDVWEHTLHALSAARPDMDATLRFALLLHDIGKPQSFSVEPNGRGHCFGHDKIGAQIARTICERFHFPTKLTDKIVHLVRWHMFSIPDTPKAMRRFIVKHGKEGARDLFAIRRCDKIGLGRKPKPNNPLQLAFERAHVLLEQQLSAKPVFGVCDLAIGGDDLLAMGYQQGPAIGTTLKAVLDAVVDGELPNERKALLEYVKTRQAIL